MHAASGKRLDVHAPDVLVSKPNRCPGRRGTVRLPPCVCVAAGGADGCREKAAIGLKAPIIVIFRFCGNARIVGHCWS